MANFACKANVCLDTTSTSRPIMCDTCRSLFHCSCVSVNEDVTLILEQQNGFFWRCSTCILNDVSAIRFQKILTIMENMNNPFSNIVSNTSILSDDSFIRIDDDAIEDENDATKTPTASKQKRQRSVTPCVAIPIVKKKKLNFNQPDPEAGTSSSSACAVSEPVNPGKSFDIMDSIVRKSDQYFHLSQFRPETSNDDIKTYIINKLKCRPENITCHKLVSSKRDSRRPLTFVSFKVGTTKNLAKSIVKKGVWPKGINIKPFEDHSKNGVMSSIPHRERSRSRNHQPGPNMAQQVVNNLQGGRRYNPQPQRQRQRQHNNSMAWRVSRN